MVVEIYTRGLAHILTPTAVGTAVGIDVYAAERITARITEHRTHRAKSVAERASEKPSRDAHGKHGHHRYYYAEHRRPHDAHVVYIPASGDSPRISYEIIHRSPQGPEHRHHKLTVNAIWFYDHRHYGYATGDARQSQQ